MTQVPDDKFADGVTLGICSSPTCTSIHIELHRDTPIGDKTLVAAAALDVADIPHVIAKLQTYAAIIKERKAGHSITHAKH